MGSYVTYPSSSFAVLRCTCVTGRTRTKTRRWPRNPLRCSLESSKHWKLVRQTVHRFTRYSPLYTTCAPTHQTTWLVCKTPSLHNPLPPSPPHYFTSFPRLSLHPTPHVSHILTMFLFSPPAHHSPPSRLLKRWLCCKPVSSSCPRSPTGRGVHRRWSAFLWCLALRTL